MIFLALLAAANIGTSTEPLEKPIINCEGDYTMYTHPDQRCRDKLADEYQALLKQLLDKAKKAKEK